MLLLSVVLTAIANFLHWSPTWITVIAARSAARSRCQADGGVDGAHLRQGRPGGRVLMNATFGNAAEPIIALFALKTGLIDVVKASITGSIIGNVLLVLGASMLAGGIEYEEQHFNKTLASGAVALRLWWCPSSLMMPAALTFAAGTQSTTDATTCRWRSQSS